MAEDSSEQNSSTPFENPTIISNLIELYSMMLLPGACVITFGKMAAERKKEKTGNAVAKIKRNVTCFGSQGRTIFAAMSILFLVGLTVCYLAEKSGNPLLAEAGLDQTVGNMEGKEVRFGVAQSALFTTTTTSFTTGTVNNMHDSLTPLGGMIPMLHMMLKLCVWRQGCRIDEYDHVCDPCCIFMRSDDWSDAGIPE